eukprot:GSChrysophyteH1.ASY1.ANO1.1587.1 assembled CDS
MIAGAKDIDASVVGLVYLCSILPSLTIKLTGPYWYHLLSYRQRVIVGTVLMALSFIFVAIGGPNNLTGLQLLGVAMGSAQSGLGEASFLALASFYNPSRKALTAWSSGTGVAGIVGYGWVVCFTEGFKTSFAATIWAALAVFPLAYFLIFEVLMNSPSPESLAASARQQKLGGASVSAKEENHSAENPLSSLSSKTTGHPPSTEDGNEQASPRSKDRVRAVAHLWPYMVPLFTVYAAEYTLQAGVWSAMGFPVEDVDARRKFYEYSNFVYQAGVLCSRSSGTLWTPTRLILWIMPFLQCVFLAFSIYNAYHMVWYDWSILTLCFGVGLLGGAVYVGGFSLVAIESPPSMKEFNLSAASVGDSFGIAVANLASIAVQRAIYKNYDIHD